MELIGRKAELASLVECVLGAMSGSPCFVVLEGPPATGKSVLLSATAQAAAMAGARVLRAWGNAAETNLPFGVAGQLFELALDGASDEERRAWLRGSAATVTRILNVDGRGAAAQAEGLDLHAASRALYWLTANASRHVPLVLLVDNLQWTDADSLRWLIYLSRRLKGLPLVVVAALSPDVPNSTSSLMNLLGGGVERLSLSGLDVADVARLAARLTGTQPTASLAARLVRETGGLPLLLRSVLEASMESPTASITADSPLVGTPKLGRTVLMRLSQADPGIARLAIAVATLDRSDLDTAASVAGLPLAEATSAAATLSRLEMVTLSDQIAFRYDLVRHALLAALPEAERAEYEIRAAHARYERCAPAATVAAHLVRTARPIGEDWAVAALWSSAEEAIRQGATERAVAALRRLLAEPHQSAARARYLAELAALEVYESPAAAAENLGIALPRLEEPRLLASAAGRLASALLDSGAAAEAVAVLSTQSRRLAAADRERADQLQLQRMTMVSWARAYCHEVATGLDELVERVRGRGPAPRLKPVADALLAFRLGGDAKHLQQVRHLATTALDGIAAKDDLDEDDLGEIEKITAFGSAAAVLLQSGCYGLVAEHAGMQMAAADGRGWQLLSGWSRAILAAAQLGLNRYEQAAASATAALAAPVCALGGRHRLPTVLATAVLADSHAELGRHEDGMTLLTRAGLDAEVPKFWVYDHVLRARGRLRLAAGDTAAALGDLLRLGQRGSDRGDGRSPSLSWRPLAASAHAMLGAPQKAVTLAREQVALARVAAPTPVLVEALLVHGLIGQRTQPIREAVRLQDRPDAALSDEPLGQALGLLREHGSRLLASQLERAARAAVLPAGQVGTATGPSVAGKARRPAFGPDALTAHEHRLIAMAVAGQTNDAIAQAFAVSRRAVEFHFTHIYRKLGINGRSHLWQFADPSAT